VQDLLVSLQKDYTPCSLASKLVMYLLLLFLAKTATTPPSALQNYNSVAKLTMPLQA